MRLSDVFLLRESTGEPTVDSAIATVGMALDAIIDAKVIGSDDTQDWSMQLRDASAQSPGAAAAALRSLYNELYQEVLGRRAGTVRPRPATAERTKEAPPLAQLLDAANVAVAAAQKAATLLVLSAIPVVFEFDDIEPDALRARGFETMDAVNATADEAGGVVADGNAFLVAWNPRSWRLVSADDASKEPIGFHSSALTVLPSLRARPSWLVPISALAKRAATVGWRWPLPRTVSQPWLAANWSLDRLLGPRPTFDDIVNALEDRQR